MIFRVVRTQQRSLGTVTRGPRLRDIAGNWKKACEFFTTPALGYWEFQQRCSSVRLFAFWGVVAYLSADLIANPPRSSYWHEWNLWRWPVHVYHALTKQSDSIFKTGNEREIDVPAAYAFLVANRRMPDEDSKAQ
jgi:hypothetical protein